MGYKTHGYWDDDMDSMIEAIVGITNDIKSFNEGIARDKEELEREIADLEQENEDLENRVQELEEE